MEIIYCRIPHPQPSKGALFEDVIEWLLLNQLGILKDQKTPLKIQKIKNLY